MNDLKQKTIRGGIVRLCAQAATFLLRVGSLMILARLLDPKDFGLVGMVTAFTGVFDLFRDFGLSAAAVQRKIVTEEQISNLFWINISIGILLGLVALAMAPTIAAFYHEPRLVSVTAVLAGGFLFNGAGIQHSALLQRHMRFTALAVIGVGSLMGASAIAIAGAKAGYGYWALVAMTVGSPLLATIGFWAATGWIPAMPSKRSGVRSMLGFGGTLTVNGLIAYVAYNFEKVLIGRVWGANAIGIYGRAYQLINIPTANLNSAIGEVAFSALARLQDDPGRLRTYFLKGYSLVLAMTLPITIACALFADDMVAVVLGPKWNGAVVILRLLSPTILIFALINPLGWLMYSLGLLKRSLKLAMAFAPTIIVGYVIGLPYGPKGVAFAYSLVMVLWVVPFIKYCVRYTGVSGRDILQVVSSPVLSGICAGVFAIGARLLCPQSVPPLARLILESAVLFLTFVGILLFVAGQKSFYLNVLRELKGPTSLQEKSFASA